MPVRREELQRPRAYLRVEVPRAIRQRNGRWGLSVRIVGPVDLGGGRVVKLDRVVQLSERADSGRGGRA